MTRANAWKEGYNAYKSGLSYFDNPHVQIDNLANIIAPLERSVAWSAGWIAAYQMDNTKKGS